MPKPSSRRRAKAKRIAVGAKPKPVRSGGPIPLARSQPYRGAKYNARRPGTNLKLKAARLSHGVPRKHMDDAARRQRLKVSMPSEPFWWVRNEQLGPPTVAYNKTREAARRRSARAQRLSWRDEVAF